tara:strand:- start:248 stop:514 length:267 start_codon:yes stop_codon:yes gene_type:complete
MSKDSLASSIATLREGSASIKERMTSSGRPVVEQLPVWLRIACRISRLADIDCPRHRLLIKVLGERSEQVGIMLASKRNTNSDNLSKN